MSLSFEWDRYQLVELDELILLVCFVFPRRASFVQNMTQNIRISTYYYQRRSILEASYSCFTSNSHFIIYQRIALDELDVDLKSRDSIIKLQSLVHNQLSSPVFKPMISYAWSLTIHFVPYFSSSYISSHSFGPTLILSREFVPSFVV